MDRRPVILFDVMDTLVTDPYYEAMPVFFGMSFGDLRMAVHPASWIEFEEGRISEAEYLARFFRDGQSVDGQALIPCLRNAYRWIEGMKELLADGKGLGHDLMESLSKEKEEGEKVSDYEKRILDEAKKALDL